jgi:hypothetical protein
MTAGKTEKALGRFRRAIAVAWRRIHFLGHYLFKDRHHPISLEVFSAGNDLV